MSLLSVSDKTRLDNLEKIMERIKSCILLISKFIILYVPSIRKTQNFGGL